MKKGLVNLLAAAALWLCPTAPALACAVCLTGDGADGYNASLLFLMSTPYLVGGAIAGGLVMMYRRGQRRREQTDDETTPGSIQEESSR